MIYKPADYDTTKASTGGSQKLPAGAYYCGIAGVELTKSRGGADMLKLHIEIIRGDYAGYFKKQMERWNDEKWPSGGTLYQVIEGKSLPMFKGLIENLQASNDGFDPWGDNNALEEYRLKGLRIGCIFREEEYQKNDGTVGTATRIYGTCPLDQVETIKPPAKKTLDGSTELQGGAGQYQPPLTDEQIPF